MRAEIAVRPKLAEEGFAQCLRLLLRLRVRLLDLGRATLGYRSRQGYRRFGRKAEGYEEGWIVDVDLNFLAMRVERRLKREREVQRKQALVVMERSVLRRFERKSVGIADMNEGEVIELFSELIFTSVSGLSSSAE